jgi:hypothetical protein
VNFLKRMVVLWGIPVNESFLYTGKNGTCNEIAPLPLMVKGDVAADGPMPNLIKIFPS